MAAYPRPRCRNELSLSCNWHRPRPVFSPPAVRPRFIARSDDRGEHGELCKPRHDGVLRYSDMGLRLHGDFDTAMGQWDTHDRGKSHCQHRDSTDPVEHGRPNESKLRPAISNLPRRWTTCRPRRHPDIGEHKLRVATRDYNG